MKTIPKLSIVLMALTSPCYASEIESMYHQVTADSQYPQEAPLTPVGSHQFSRPYEVPEDTTQVLVSPARVHPTDIPVKKDIEVADLNNKIIAMKQQINRLQKQSDAIQATQAVKVTGTVQVVE